MRRKLLIGLGCTAIAVTVTVFAIVSWNVLERRGIEARMDSLSHHPTANQLKRLSLEFIVYAAEWTDPGRAMDVKEELYFAIWDPVRMKHVGLNRHIGPFRSTENNFELDLRRKLKVEDERLKIYYIRDCDLIEVGYNFTGTIWISERQKDDSYVAIYGSRNSSYTYFNGKLILHSFGSFNF